MPIARARKVESSSTIAAAEASNNRIGSPSNRVQLIQKAFTVIFFQLYAIETFSEEEKDFYFYRYYLYIFHHFYLNCLLYDARW